LAVVAWMILKAGKRLPIKQFMSAAVTLIMFLSVAFIGNAVRSLQESGLINATSLLGTFPRLPRPLADFTGIHPTVETLVAQAILAAIYIGGALFMWWKQREHQPASRHISAPKIKETKLT
jgi:high-affinity iron transporter